VLPTTLLRSPSRCFRARPPSFTYTFALAAHHRERLRRALLLSPIRAAHKNDFALARLCSRTQPPQPHNQLQRGLAIFVRISGTQSKSSTNKSYNSACRFALPVSRSSAGLQTNFVCSVLYKFTQNPQPQVVDICMIFATTKTQKSQ
jgi:hypothetical protein